MNADTAVYVSAEWTKANVSSRGLLGAMYRVWGDGKQMAKGDIFDYFGVSGLTADELKSKGYVVWTQPQEKGSFISEGDTPTFMNFLDNGLRAWRNGNDGGWGGRRRAEIAGASGTPGGGGGGGGFGGRAPVPPRTALVNNAFFSAAQRIASAASPDPTFQIPGDARPGQTIHVILEASDSGTPSLTRHQRVIVPVSP